MSQLEKLKDRMKSLDKIPEHIAIIMDGNGRWAKAHDLPIRKGHSEGVKAVRRIVEIAREINIKVLTLYTFSSENWSRSQEEINALMQLLKSSVFKELNDLIKNGVRLRVSGDLDGLPLAQKKAMKYAIEKTAKCDKLILNLALNYGGRQEIIQAVQKIAQDCKNDKFAIEDIDDSLFESYLYTSGLSDPDLLIRTGGNSRISNFLLWQLSYTEILILEKYWPDFQKEDFVMAVLDFANRDRRFGGRKE
ncbi:MAG: isoprenyl transferase [Candidatus Zixiibacteriota bacterium]